MIWAIIIPIIIILVIIVVIVVFVSSAKAGKASKLTKGIGGPVAENGICAQGSSTCVEGTTCQFTENTGFRCLKNIALIIHSNFVSG